MSTFDKIFVTILLKALFDGFVMFPMGQDLAKVMKVYKVLGLNGWVDYTL